ncbi:MAG: response regulator [Chloroflexi bacterium]|nr:response regulator [Chloroflexota bacterium]
MRENARILIIDDDLDLLQMMGIILEKAGFKVDKADDGNVGIRLAEQVNPDLIILDVMMPRMSGLDVCRQLRAKQETHQIPIIMLSALGEVADKVSGFAMGADDYISKPVDSQELVMRIYALLNRAQMARAGMARVISCVGAKGGVGTTTVATNVAARLAHQNYRVVLVELRPSGGILHRLLRFKSKPQSFNSLLALDPDHIKRPEVERCLSAHSSGLNLLLAPVQYNNPLTTEHVEAIFDVLTINADYIIFDLPADLDVNPSYRRALELSDQVVLVTEPEWSAVECTAAQVKLFQQWGIKERTKVAVVERAPLPSSLSEVEIENRIGLGKKIDPEQERWQQPSFLVGKEKHRGVVCIIPTAAELFHETARERVPLMLVDPNSKPAHALLDLVDVLTEKDAFSPRIPNQPGMKNGLTPRSKEPKPEKSKVKETKQKEPKVDVSAS